MEKILIILCCLIIGGSENNSKGRVSFPECESDFFEAIVEIADNSGEYISIDVLTENGIQRGVLELYELWGIIKERNKPSEELILLLKKEKSLSQIEVSKTRIQYIDVSQKVDPILGKGEEEIRSSLFGKRMLKSGLNLSENEKLVLIDQIISWCALPYFDDETGYLCFITQKDFVDWYQNRIEE